MSFIICVLVHALYLSSLDMFGNIIRIFVFCHGRLVLSLSWSSVTSLNVLHSSNSAGG